MEFLYTSVHEKVVVVRGRERLKVVRGDSKKANNDCSLLGWWWGHPPSVSILCMRKTKYCKHVCNLSPIWELNRLFQWQDSRRSLCNDTIIEFIIIPMIIRTLHVVGLASGGEFGGELWWWWWWWWWEGMHSTKMSQSVWMWTVKPLKNHCSWPTQIMTCLHIMMSHRTGRCFLSNSSLL